LGRLGIVHHDPRPLGREFKGDGPSNSSGTARHEGDFIFEHHGFSNIYSFSLSDKVAPSLGFEGFDGCGLKSLNPLHHRVLRPNPARPIGIFLHELTDRGLIGSFVNPKNLG